MSNEDPPTPDKKDMVTVSVDETNIPSASPPNTEGGAMGGIIFLLILVLLFAMPLVAMIGMIKVFSKAGHPGWMAIIPGLNLYILVQIADKPMWLFILFFIPTVNIIPAILVPIEISKKFGKSILFAMGLCFLPFVFYPILGFGSAEYHSNTEK